MRAMFEGSCLLRFPVSLPEAPWWFAQVVGADAPTHPDCLSADHSDGWSSEDGREDPSVRNKRNR